MVPSLKRIDGRLVNIVDQGTGPAILFVHGFPLDHSMWKHQIDSLSDQFRVIAPDLRGFGTTESDDKLTTMRQFADDLAAIIEATDGISKVTLCGLSMGGYIAWEFLQNHSGLVERLILCDTKASADSPEARQTRLDNAARVLQEGHAFIAEGMMEKLFSRKTLSDNTEIVEETKQVILNSSPTAIAAALHGMAQRSDMTSILSGIEIPTLVIVGEEDGITTREEMEQMARSIPSATFCPIPDAGHMAPLEQPELVTNAIREFLTKHPIS
ncbi:3-oxoadipate enol-lactonase 2 [Thalassoglobus neptunius]|uniref:3-oxoadipate enol-lactonase 2 n=1 Tax=Thalassoglobus neptunius TaxID=1938619 RepID=A0A5C5W9Y1_9PLAN|nr:alpha/beta fold hydrolase [Thalassoglobus neptunius]TWT47005.1 3-oxoadipate enol-lactonase 2 [Thalassoglobus neptunius]